MRLVTWNCRAGPLDVKLRALEKLRFDIAVVPESPDPRCESDAQRWIGNGSRRGLLVKAAPGYRLRALEIKRLPSFFVPIEVTGAAEFLLIAVWAMPNKRETRYVRGVVRAAKRCAPLIRSQPTVLLGDFNSNPYWDHLYPKDANHSALVAILEDLGCVSAYHHLRGERHGAESQPTYFQYNHADKPYHLDYCFVPASWSDRVERVLIGKHDQWRRWSDHRPVIVDLSATIDTDS